MQTHNKNIIFALIDIGMRRSERERAVRSPIRLYYLGGSGKGITGDDDKAHTHTPLESLVCVVVAATAYYACVPSSD